MNTESNSEVSAFRPSVMPPMGGDSSSLNHCKSFEFPYLDDGCNGIDGSVKNNIASCMQGVCVNAPMSSSSHINNNNVWKKHGVVPLPSLKDLGDGSTQDGVAHLDENEVKYILDRFQVALVGRLFCHRLPFYHLNVELKCRWECFGQFKLITVSSDCFICLFEFTSVQGNVIMGGPWVIIRQVLGLAVWSSGFSPAIMHGSLHLFGFRTMFQSKDRIPALDMVLC